MEQQPVIKSVLDNFGVWNGAIEREYIRSQQRAPEPEPSRSAFAEGVRERITGFLVGHPGWWTISEVAEATTASVDQTRYSLKVLQAEGRLVLQQPTFGYKTTGVVQRYRWRV